MKKIALLFGIFALFSSCVDSPESKADAIIKKELIKTLYKPDTYKPVATTVDSAFSPNDNPVIFEKMRELTSIAEDFESNQNELKQAKSSLALWSGTYDHKRECPFPLGVG